MKMFWGLIMEPNKRYTQVVEKPFHISQAAMDTSTGDNESCQVMVVVDGKNFLVCTLQKNKQIQVPLDLYFKSGDSVSFLTNGKCNIHLTGYLDPEFDEDQEEIEEAEEEEEEEEEVDEGEAPEQETSKNKRKLNDSNEASTNKKAKKDKKSKKPAAQDDSSGSDQEQLQKFLEGEDIDTDEDDESFKVNQSGADSDEDDSGEEEEEEVDDDEEEQEDEAEEENESSAADTSLDTSKEVVDMSKLSKAQRKRLKKKLAQQAKEGKKPQVNGVDKAKKAEPQQKADKKKPEIKKEEAPEKKEKKSVSGGVSIEDTKVGEGPVAKPGKVVLVYYEGRLKTNNKMIDNCQKGPGFKFRLGAKEVISGWDVGITGMKVGGKRRIICPPAMAYGAKGSPPVIPPNSTLVFDVELKNVK